MANNKDNKDSCALNTALCDVLTRLSHNPYPHVSKPPGCKKRASIACILRIRPDYHHYPSASDVGEFENLQGFSPKLESFFAQSWVQHGDAEVVFIKRAARQGDRWTSHVALPGGKQDSEDVDDKATAVRETFEEIGLDLTSPDVLFVGNLPERIVHSTLMNKPLMVLCPFLFIYTKPDLPPLKLQPGEVASAHWVPLRILLSPSVRTYEYTDISSRFTGLGIVPKKLLQPVLGRLRFSAVRLIPSESIFCSTTAEFFPRSQSSSDQMQTNHSFLSQLSSFFSRDGSELTNQAHPLLLWGLTLGVLVDFLDQLPPHNAVNLWTYPTFTSFDTRCIMKILSPNLEARYKASSQVGNTVSQTAIDGETEAIAITTGDEDGSADFLDGGMAHERGPVTRPRQDFYTTGTLSEDFLKKAMKGVCITVLIRLVGTVALTYNVLRWLRKRL